MQRCARAAADAAAAGVAAGWAQHHTALHWLLLHAGRVLTGLCACLLRSTTLQGGEDMDMDDAPAAEPEPRGPIVDADGFEVVQRRGRGRR